MVIRRMRGLNEADISQLLNDLVNACRRRNTSEIDDAWSEVFDEVVPVSGNADTVGGEIVRAVGKIAYRRWNDGDCIGVDYGNETCNAPARYLIEVTGKPVKGYVIDMWRMGGYGMKEVYKLIRVTAEWLLDNVELFSKKNRDDMLDWSEPEGSHYDEEEDEDEY